MHSQEVTDAPAKPRRRRWRRWVVLATCLLLLVGAATGGLARYLNGIDKGIKRVEPIAGDRPAKTVDGALNILLVGSDSRDPGADNGQSDTMMVLHINAAHNKAYVISVPRDLWINIPDRGEAKINAAYAWGGLQLTAKTVESYTGLRLDHVVAIDFAGFKKAVDALGGVDLTVEQQITSIHPPYRTFAAGKQHMNGEQALDYVRQRKQFPDGDFARMRHQQELIKAVLDKAASTETLTNPAKLHGVLTATANTITADKDFSLTDLALQFRNLRSSDIVPITIPTLGTGWVGDQSVVLPDNANTVSLFQAVANDTVDTWLATHTKT